MKDFIKANLVLVVGLTLPLLLIMLFFAATVIPKAFGTPPQYEMLFTTVRYDYQAARDDEIDFAVKNQKLIVKSRKNDHKDRGYQSKLLMVYDAKSETVREINVDAVKAEGALNNNETVLDETAGWTIDTSRVSPDGYILDGPSYSGGGMLGGMFGAGYRNGGFRIKKGSAAYRIPDTQGDYYYNQVQFVGWVVKK